jgi:hypothetical protein
VLTGSCQQRTPLRRAPDCAAALRRSHEQASPQGSAGGRGAQLALPRLHTAVEQDHGGSVASHRCTTLCISESLRIS